MNVREDSEFVSFQGPGQTVRTIATGGFATVDEVETSSGEIRARKRLIGVPDSNAHRTNVARFEREVQIMQSLASPFVVEILDSYDYQYSEDALPLPSYTMPVAEGSLNDLWEKRGGAKGWEANAPFYLSLLNQAAMGLAYLHVNDILHRDFKPANLLIFDGSRLRLSDFGNATSPQPTSGVLTHTFTRIHTDGFVAPEQMQSLKAACPQSDVFSFGATLYYLMTGSTVQYDSKEIQRNLERFPQPLGELVRECLSLDIHQRPEDGVMLALRFRDTYRELYQNYDYGRLKIPRDDLVRAHALILKRGDNRLLSVLQHIIQTTEVPLSLCYTEFDNRALETIASFEDRSIVYRLFETIDERFKETNSWNDAELVGEMYRTLLTHMSRQTDWSMENQPDQAFAKRLASSVLMVSARLNRYQGGREFLKMFCQQPQLPTQLFEEILTAHPRERTFIVDDVNSEWMTLTPEMRAIMS